MTVGLAEELHSGVMEFALLQLEVQRVLMEPLKDLCNMVAMTGQVPGVDEYIIDVDSYEGVEKLIHEFLEDGGGIGEVIWHNEAFHSSPSRIRTSLYALRRASLEKIHAPQSSSRAAWTRGNGYGSFTIWEFRVR